MRLTPFNLQRVKVSQSVKNSSWFKICGTTLDYYLGKQITNPKGKYILWQHQFPPQRLDFHGRQTALCLQWRVPLPRTHAEDGWAARSV